MIVLEGECVFKGPDTHLSFLFKTIQIDTATINSWRCFPHTLASIMCWVLFTFDNLTRERTSNFNCIYLVFKDTEYFPLSVLSNYISSLCIHCLCGFNIFQSIWTVSLLKKDIICLHFVHKHFPIWIIFLTRFQFLYSSILLISFLNLKI